MSAQPKDQLVELSCAYKLTGEVLPCPPGWRVVMVGTEHCEWQADRGRLRELAIMGWARYGIQRTRRFRSGHEITDDEADVSDEGMVALVVTDDPSTHGFCIVPFDGESYGWDEFAQLGIYGPGQCPTQTEIDNTLADYRPRRRKQ